MLNKWTYNDEGCDACLGDVNFGKSYNGYGLAPCILWGSPLVYRKGTNLYSTSALDPRFFGGAHGRKRSQAVAGT